MFKFEILQLVVVGAEKCYRDKCIPPLPGCGQEDPGVWVGPIWAGNTG